MKKLVLMIIPALICGMVFSSCVSYKEEAKDEDEKKGELEIFRENNQKKVSVSQGVWGTILKIEGDCMPGIVGEERPNPCRVFPVIREVLVFEYTTDKDVVYSLIYPTFYEKVNTKLIARTTSDNEGFFELALQPGKYSVFVIEDGLLYAAGCDGLGGINPLTVELSNVSEHIFKISYGSSN